MIEANRFFVTCRSASHGICNVSTENWTCVITRTHSTLGDTAFAAAGPGLWNSLPPHLRDADLPCSWFWRSLKTFLFGQWDHGAVQTILTVLSKNNIT